MNWDTVQFLILLFLILAVAYIGFQLTVLLVDHWIGALP